MEMWKPVKREGYTDYQVSSHGQVRSTKFRRLKILKQIPCIDLRRNATSHYQFVHLYNNGKRMNAAVHILVAEAFIEKPEDAIEVNHKDGIKDHNGVENLEWMTQLANMQHAHKTGLIPRCKGFNGSLNPMSKLSETEVWAIRSASGRQTAIAEKFGVSQPLISLIRAGKVRKG